MPGPRKFYYGVDNVNQRLVRLADAVDATDAVTLQQVQAWIRGLRWKDPVRAASTTNVSLTNPGTTMDGVALAAGDRLLLKDQTSASQNGIWVWTGGGTTLTRALDADAAAELRGASVLVLEGTVNADRQFNQTVDTITLETTSLNWAEFGGATIYTAGTGLSVAGRQFSVVTGYGITTSGGVIAVDTTVITRKFAATLTSAISAGGSVDVTHGLGTLDFTYTTRDSSTGEMVELDVRPKDTNTATVSSAVALPANSVRLTVTG